MFHNKKQDIVYMKRNFR